MKKTVCELFAGVGGFRVGLEKSNKGWKTVWANQREPGKKNQYAFDCYCANFGGKRKHYSNEDIGSVDKKSIPEHNLLVGGFPCQDYSVASTGAKGIQGKKGVLWRQIRDILITKKPAFVLLENVDRLLKSPRNQKGRDFGIILQTFKEEGYIVEWRVINAAEYGFVQRRRRTFIFACRNDTKYAESLKDMSFEKILHKDGFFFKEFPIKNITIGREYKFKYRGLLNISKNFTLTFGNAGVMMNGKIYSENTMPDYRGEYKLLKDIVEKKVDSKYQIKQNIQKWKKLKGAKAIPKKVGTYEYVFREGAIAFPDPLNRPARTMLTSEGTLNRSTHVIKQGKELRLLTPIETERINGFPDNWTNTGMPDRVRYFCMGNALVVGLIEKMGHRLNTIFNKEDKSQTKKKDNKSQEKTLINIRLLSVGSLYSVLTYSKQSKKNLTSKVA